MDQPDDMPHCHEHNKARAVMIWPECPFRRYQWPMAKPKMPIRLQQECLSHRVASAKNPTICADLLLDGLSVGFHNDERFFCPIGQVLHLPECV
jgi:hypothetical protein